MIQNLYAEWNDTTPKGKMCPLGCTSDKYPHLSGNQISNCASAIKTVHKQFNQTSETGPEVIKKFMLNSAEHEILNDYKYKNIKKFGSFQAQISLECYFSWS